MVTALVVWSPPWRHPHYLDGNQAFELGINIWQRRVRGHGAEAYISLMWEVHELRMAGKTDPITHQPDLWERMSEYERDIVTGISWARGRFQHVRGQTPKPFNGPFEPRIVDAVTSHRRLVGVTSWGAFTGKYFGEHDDEIHV